MAATYTIQSSSRPLPPERLTPTVRRDARNSQPAMALDATPHHHSFSNVMTAISSDWGRSLGLRSVERELNGQMFKPTPRDARATLKELAHKELSAVDPRAQHAPNVHDSIPNEQLSAGADAGSVGGQRIGSATGGTHESQISTNHAAPGESAGISAKAASGSRPSGNNAVRTGHEHPAAPNPNPSATTVSANSATQGTHTAAAVVPANTASSRSGTSAGNASVAHHVGRVLHGTQSADAATARAVSSSNDPQPAQNQGQSATKHNVRGNDSEQHTQTSSNAKEAGRSVEPTPFDELVKSIRLRARPDFSTARLRLDPPELGHVRVDVRLTPDRLELNVQTESPEAARLVQARVDELRTALEHHGIRIDHSDVRVEVADVRQASDTPGDTGQTSAHSASRDDDVPQGDAQGRHRSGSDESSTLGMELDADAFWNGATWAGVSHHRVDVRI